ncbi:MAG TPA: tRNA (adenosine(37)-N6)-threonylcarbamoyltransferase complex dimerization subunit type 1 TsaB [Thermoanaerobaculia bacterium]|nr:tRNA (adenosine(37)-N6)-threonylcarbamoyltransferase complex dimerization subunit type 1 TsaB [Thermoanaerobaculia bacterium]
MPAVPTAAAPLVLVLDSGAPLVSVTVGRPSKEGGGEVLALRSMEIARSSRQLLEMVGEVLAEVGARPRDLGGVAALRGPGSFTGLRIGLSTVLGLHQALGLPATAVSTLAALAASLPSEEGGLVVAAVDALRGEWSAQAFAVGAGGSAPRPLTGIELVPGSELPGLVGGTAVVTGFGVGRLAELPGWPAGVRLHEAGPLAPAGLRLAGPPGPAWDPALLTSPFYSRPPAVTVPRERVPATP